LVLLQLIKQETRRPTTPSQATPANSLNNNACNDTLIGDCGNDSYIVNFADDSTTDTVTSNDVDSV